ncbi:oligopeptide transporter, OPT family [candidate division KSB1 bacterium]|nr:oligopeptide transporter, OPT family [candidate division KSB1 bacterium]
MAEAKATGGTSYKPFVPAETDMKELTLKAILLGIVLAIVLGAANVYLGLKAGMTVAATFPAAVISMAVLKLFKGTILEENMARTTGAVGEALAAGAIFTIPAFIIAGVWDEFHYFQSTLLMLVGGVLGVLFVIILRRALIEDVTLPYPESKACAEIVKIGQSGSSGAAYVFLPMLLAGVIEFFKNSNGLTLIKDHVKGIFSFGVSKIALLDSETSKVITGGESSHEGRMFLQSPSASPAFLGVGYIIGFKLAAITFSGGVLGWLFLMPIILFVMSNDLSAVISGSADWMTVAKAAYNATVKPIAVGGMLVGAFYTLFKMRKSLIAGVGKGIADIAASQKGDSVKVSRIDKDAPFGMVFIAIIVLVICMVFLYNYFTGGFGSAIVAAIVMAVAGFIFAAVAGYLVGIIGSSSNPISGLTLSTLLIAALLMLAVGLGGKSQGIAATLAVASVVCCVAGVAGDMMQDWKVGHILGATPYRMQIGGMIGVVAAAVVLVLPIMWLHQANGIGTDALPAPQAGLMAMMSKGIISGDMAWPLVVAGMFFAIALILINSPSPMLIAVGMYLPFTTTFAIFIGGIFKFATEKLGAKDIEQETDNEKKEEKRSMLESMGLLISSGLVAGEALIGIILAILVVSSINLNEILGNVNAAGEAKAGFAILGLLIFIILAFVMIYFPLKAIRKEKK